MRNLGIHCANISLVNTNVVIRCEINYLSLVFCKMLLKTIAMSNIRILDANSCLSSTNHERSQHFLWQTFFCNTDQKNATSKKLQCSISVLIAAIFFTSEGMRVELFFKFFCSPAERSSSGNESAAAGDPIALSPCHACRTRTVSRQCGCGGAC